MAICGLILLLVFLGDLKFRQWQNQRAIEKQELSLQQQADSLQKKNDQLSQSLQYLNSSDFKEEVARQQLGYKKDGETVYGFSADGQETAQNTVAQSGAGDAGKWWNYFFSD
jgi:cell division protein FtsB